jgi:hypothetical protein
VGRKEIKIKLLNFKFKQDPPARILKRNLIVKTMVQKLVLERSQTASLLRSLCQDAS